MVMSSNDIGTREPRRTSRDSRTPPSKAWVDPASLPTYNHTSSIAGNVPDYVKQLNYNTFMCYGVGEPDSFGYKVGRAVKFVEVNVNRKMDRNERLEATTIAEIEVTKRSSSFLHRSHCVICFLISTVLSPFFHLDMLNGAGMLHGGCVAYLIDK